MITLCMIPCLALAGKATAILPGTDAVSLSRSEPAFPAAIPVHGQAAVFPSKLGDSTAEQGNSDFSVQGKADSQETQYVVKDIGWDSLPAAKNTSADAAVFVVARRCA